MARTYGGISIVNAIPAGLGSAMAVDLPVDAIAMECSAGESRSMDDAFTSAVAKEASRIFGLGPLCVDVRSNIPPRSGLKSNSAVAAAIMLEASRLAGAEDRLKAAVAAARVTLALGSSITGALDDASAATLGGITLTDNRSMQVLRRDEAPMVDIVIYVPQAPKKLNVSRLRSIGKYYESLFELAWLRRYWTAMLLNGIAVDAALGYGLAPIIWSALSMGALSAGVSGNGPAVAAVFKDSPEEFLNSLEELEGTVLRVKSINEVT